MTMNRELPLRTTCSVGVHPFVACPVCGGEYVSLGIPQTDGRGDITLPANCEGNHAFEIRFEFHKGNTSVFCRMTA